MGHMIVLANIKELAKGENGQLPSITQILLTFIIFLIIYEIPTFLFKLKIERNQARLIEEVNENGQMFHTDRVIDVRDPVTKELQRSDDIDFWMQASFPAFDFFH